MCTLRCVQQRYYRYRYKCRCQHRHETHSGTHAYSTAPMWKLLGFQTISENTKSSLFMLFCINLYANAEVIYFYCKTRSAEFARTNIRFNFVLLRFHYFHIWPRPSCRMLSRNASVIVSEMGSFNATVWCG